MASDGTTPNASSAETSPIGDEKREAGLELEEAEEERGREENLDSKDLRTANEARPLAVPIQQIRSRSSARSTRSYAAEGEYARADEDAAKPDGEEDQEFEVTFDGDADPYNPKNRPYLRKWLIVLIVSSSSLCVTCASALYSSTYAQLEAEFHVSREVATVGLTTFVCGLGLGPMFLSPLSEFYGRRIVYLFAFGMFFIWLIPCAVANNIVTMLIARFFDGLAGSAFLSVAGGTVGDMFYKNQLSAPMMVYTASPMVGPEIGPLMGGFINQFTDWRWSFYVLLIWAGVQFAMIFFFVPETYAPVLLRRKAVKLRKDTGDERWKAPIEIMDRSVARTVLWSCIRPFQLLVLEPMCLNLCLLSAILLGILYLFFGAFPLVFQNNHDFNEWQTGLSFLGIFVGMVIAVSCDGIWKKIYARLVEKNNGVSEPEFRLPSTMLGACLVPVGLIGFGWTTFRFVPWIFPIIFSGIFGTGMIWCYSGIFTFLVECCGSIIYGVYNIIVAVRPSMEYADRALDPLYAASALAANSFSRSCFGAAFPLFGVQMFDKLGYQWASSLLGFLALAMTPFPIVFFRIGKTLRGKSRFAAAR